MRKSAVCGMAACVFCLASFAPALGEEASGNGRLKGKLMDFAGKPIALARIELKYVEPLPVQGTSAAPAAAGEPPASTLVTKTNKKGLWGYGGLSSGVWEVTALADGYLPVSRRCAVSQVWTKSLVLLEAEKKPTQP
ncbi:MAG: hypothetical protein ABFD80_03635 [Acidobacteriota bacterium]